MKVFLPRLFWVNVYLVNREYGGPEEGGWYYDVGVIIQACGPYPRFLRGWARRTQKRLEHKAHLMNTQDGRRPPASVLCGDYYQVRLETTRGQDFPDSPPTYS